MALGLDVTELESILMEVIDTVSPRRLETRDRQGRWFSLRAVPYRTLDNRIDGAVLILVDIDDLKRSAESLQSAKNELVVADRDKDRFLAMLAHELRNPLAPMRNVGAVLKGKTALDPAALDWASGVLERQVHAMTRMIDDLLDASRVTQGKVQLREEAVDLKELLEHVVVQARGQLEEKRQVLAVDLPSSPCRSGAIPCASSRSSATCSATPASSRRPARRSSSARGCCRPASPATACRRQPSSSR
jgi:signal transduction histidine kinase